MPLLLQRDGPLEADEDVNDDGAAPTVDGLLVTRAAAAKAVLQLGVVLDEAAGGAHHDTRPVELIAHLVSILIHEQKKACMLA